MDINKDNNNSAPEKMEIEISRYKTLIEALGDPKRVVRLIVILLAVVVILAFGIVGIIYGIKRFYPYKSINSNDYGATFIKDEDNEIIYWLFNAADLWANSGIEVKEGDVISVHTSGAFNPAIHHLVQDADRNNALRDPWVLSGGKGRLEYGQLYNQEAARDKFRIAPNVPFSTILMQVIPNDIADKDRGWIREPINAPYVDGYADTICSHPKPNTDWDKQKKDKYIAPDIYVIGQGKESIRIRTNGVLHFAVNDVPLTQCHINRMEQKKETKDEFKHVKGVWYFIPCDSFYSIFNYEEINKRIESAKWFVYDASREAKFDSIFNHKEINKRIDSTIVKETSQEAKVNERIISTEFWNKDYLRQIGIMDDSLWFRSKYLNEKYKKLFEERQKLLLVNVDSTIKYLKYFKNIEIIQELPKAYADSAIKYCGHLKYNIKIYEKIQELPKAYVDSIAMIRYLKDLKDDLHLIDTFWIPKENEYYKDRRFVDAWFVDNVGSFMIVIERKTDK